MTGARRNHNDSRSGGKPLKRALAHDAIDRDALDPDAQRVVSRLQSKGHEAYFVGGCVRDLMIGRVPKDFDVATSAHPQEIRRLFRNGRIIGRRFRLVHIYYGNHIVETSTFRADPAEESEGDDLLIVEDNIFGTAAEDARRRDFTVNGLFLDPAHDTILDYVHGLQDLERRILRTIGDPMVRLAEDPVRIMRAIKFATRLSFRIEDRTWEAMCELAPQLSRSAPPRVLDEIMRLMRSGTALGAFRMLHACGALGIPLPRIEAFLDLRSGGNLEQRERAELFWRLLEALDAEVHDGFEPTTAVCIGVLLLQIVESELDPDTRTLPGRPGDIVAVAGEVIDSLAHTSRLSRRDLARAQRILSVQRRFMEVAGPRFSPLLFARSEEFPEALELFELAVEARGQGWDLVEGWRARRKRALSASSDELEEERRRTRSRSRKRRRRRRRPRR